MRMGFFYDEWRGNGIYLSGKVWTVALRWSWRIAFVRVPAKPGYSRLYVGPLEIEHRG